MKKLVLACVTSLLLLSGCSAGLDGYVVTQAYEKCSSHRGVSSLSTLGGMAKAICVDGSITENLITVKAMN